MAGQYTHIRYLDAVLVVFVIAALLFLSPVVLLWTHEDSPWYVPYLLWLGIIAAAAWVWHRRAGHEQ